MRDRPTGPELLDIVERVRRGDPSITLPEDGRYKELMIAKARGIAARQADAGDGPERRELEDLGRILGKQGSLADLTRDLAMAIRRGAYDPGTPDHDAVLDHLRDQALERVGESNPRALENLKLK